MLSLLFYLFYYKHYPINMKKEVAKNILGSLKDGKIQLNVSYVVVLFATQISFVS